jgi:hypothetical protein
MRVVQARAEACHAALVAILSCSSYATDQPLLQVVAADKLVPSLRSAIVYAMSVGAMAQDVQIDGCEGRT